MIALNDNNRENDWDNSENKAKREKLKKIKM